MTLFCPTCQSTFTGAYRCPRCGDRLVTPAEALAFADEAIPPPPELLRPSAGARVGLGCVVALGVYLGLRDALGAVVSGDAVLTLTPLLRLVGVVAGGLIAGSTRPRGSATGALVGVVCVALYLAADVAQGIPLGVTGGLTAFGMAVAGCAAGLAGGRMWPSPVELPPPPPAPPRGSSFARLAKEDRATRTGRPMAWGKVLIGAAVVLVGVQGADAFRAGLKSGSNGHLRLGGPAQAPLVDLQLATVAVILGGVLAGGGTGAGVRHGLAAGLATGLALLGGAAGGVTAANPVTESLLGILGRPTNDLMSADARLTLFAAVVGGCTLGGWLGGQLLPPLAPVWMRSRLIPMA